MHFEHVRVIIIIKNFRARFGFLLLVILVYIGVASMVTKIAIAELCCIQKMQHKASFKRITATICGEEYDFFLCFFFVWQYLYKTNGATGGLQMESPLKGNRRDLPLSLC